MRRGVLAVAIYGVLTCALLLPLLGHLGSAYAHDAGDPVLNTWILWHSTHHLPLTRAWWDGPMFYPMRDSLALSELLLALLPLSAPVEAMTGNPVLAYNIVFLLSFPLSALAVYALTREITHREDAAIVGGLAFLFVTYRAEQLSHVQVLSYYWAPLTLFALHRYQRAPQWKWLALFAGTWLLQSLANGYAMFHVSVLIALWLVWFVRPIRTVWPVLVAWGIAAVLMLPMLLHYEAVHSALHLTRDINEVKSFGVELSDFAAAAPDLTVWGGRLGAARPETAAFPGVTLIVLGMTAAAIEWHSRRGPSVQTRWQRALVLISAVAALAAFSVFLVGPWRIGPLSVRDFHKPFSIAVAARLAAFAGGPWARRMWRERSIAGFYLVATAAMYVLALGPEPRLLGRPVLYEPPYAWLMRLPGFDVLRVPARFVMPAAICTSVLVALAIARWAIGRRRVAIVALIAIGIVVDGWVTLPIAGAPSGGVTKWDDVDAVVELPLGEADVDFGAMFRAMSHGKPVVNGVSGYMPPHYLPLAQALDDGQYDALFEVALHGPIGVAIDRARPRADAIEAGLRAAGIAARGADGTWDTFVVPPREVPPVMSGEPLSIAAVRASVHQEDVGRMLDGDVRTAWGSGRPQVGGEEVTLDLGSSRTVGGLVFDMGAFSFGHAKALEIDVSDDQGAWSRAWTGKLGVLAVRGALRDPGRAPVAIDFPATQARFIRLRQTGEQAGIPWWIPEVVVVGR